MAGKKANRRSDCPLSIGLELFGDKWTLLILRDLMIKGMKTFKEFQHSGEGIASNILSDRLKRLIDLKIITNEQSESDARALTYQPTEKGLDLLPILVEIILWTAKYEKTAAPAKMIEKMTCRKDEFVNSIRHRFEG